MTRSTRLAPVDVLLALVLGVAVAALALVLRTPWHSWGDDFAAYLLQAQAMASGHVRAEVLLNGSLVLASDSLPVPSAYSWGFPTLLWMGSRVGGWELIRLKMIGGLALGATASFSFALSRSYLSRALSMLAGVLIGFQPLLLQSSDLLLSDLPFLALASATLYCMDGVYRALGRREDAYGGSLLAALLTMAAYAIRANGVPLAGAFLLMHGYFWLVTPGRRPNVLRSGALYAGAVVVLAAMYYAWSPGDSFKSYAALSVLSPGSIGHMAVATALLVPAFVPLSLFPSTAPIVTAVGLGLCIGLVTVGTWVRRPNTLGMVLFVVLDLVMLVVMPFVQGVRFLFPLLIPGVILSLCAAEYLWVSARNPLRRWPVLVRRSEQSVPVLVGAAAIFLAIHGYGIAHQPKPYELDGPYSVVSQELVRYIAEHVPADAHLAFFRPRALRLLTGHPSLAIRTPGHADRATYFVLTKWQPPASMALLAKYQLGPEYFAAHPTEYQRRFENGQFVLYQRLTGRP